jgi:nitronate monooxygenase
MDIRKIRQGGMGFNISTWLLAKTVSLLGGIGTVSGVAADRVVARILQKGDPGGHFRRALAHFPFPNMAERVIQNYFVEGGLGLGKPFKSVPRFIINPSEEMITLTVCANFAIVWLAKEGHGNPIYINYLEKIQLPHIYNIVGAMLAGVDGVTMGAGIPLEIGGVLDTISAGGNPSYGLTVAGTNVSRIVRTEFDVHKFFRTSLAGLKRPDFVPIVSTDVLAAILLKRSSGSIQGFVVEGPTAGGHNAPPRGKFHLNSLGEPVYGERDLPDWQKMQDLGLPFWLGGGYASPEKIVEAQSFGAVGVQVGSIFALSRESGLREVLKRELIDRIWRGVIRVKTDTHISPTGFPFKVVDIPGTIAGKELLVIRQSVCNQGVLLEPYDLGDNHFGYRCPAEPREIYLFKGGDLRRCSGVSCLCNGLLSATELYDAGQPATVTLGDDLSFIRKLIKKPNESYGVQDVFEYLQG